MNLGSVYNPNATIGEHVEDFELEAYHEDKIKKISLSDYAGKWVVLFFYPSDFTFVCPTELEDMADYYEKFRAMGVEVMSVSTDTVFVHKAWHDTSDAIKKVKFPMLADPTHALCKFYNVLIGGEGVSLRGTFIIDPDGVLRGMEVNDNSIGRNAKELYRKLQAAKFVRENGGNVCPAKWEPGEDTLEPSLDLVGKI
jgi:peroxiredoxin (alkyl hydroperoxide reductase subunit C)